MTAWLRRGSQASLVASGVFASLYLSSSYMISNRQEARGHALAAATGGVLSGTMAYRLVVRVHTQVAKPVGRKGSFARARSCRQVLWRRWAVHRARTMPSRRTSGAFLTHSSQNREFFAHIRPT